MTDLNISVDLTADGVEKWPEIVEIIFQFIYLIHQLSEDELQQQFRKYSVSINNGNVYFFMMFFATDCNISVDWEVLEEGEAIDNVQEWENFE